MGTQDSAVAWRRKRRRKRKGKKRGEERGRKREEERKTRRKKNGKGKMGVLVLLWPPPSYLNSEVPDGGEAVARDAWESIWGQGSGYIQIPTRGSSWADATAL